MSPRPRPELPPEASVLHGSSSQDPNSPRNIAASAIRDAIDTLVSRDVPDAVLLEEAKVVAGAVARMEAAAAPGKRVRSAPDITGHPQDYFPNSPMSGWANPLSLPIDLWGVESDDGPPIIRGRAVFSLAYEGPPTCLHGGMVALLFDEILGNANLIAGSPGMTGTLTVRYRRPTPLLIPLDLEARRVKVDGRKITTVGSISVDGEITAEAEAIFIEVPPTQMLGIAGRHAEKADGDVVDPELKRLIEEAG